jgi:proline iminopeptidase
LSELRFFYQDGASHLFPDAWCVRHSHLTYNFHSRIFFIIRREEYLAPIPESERDNLISAYHKQLNSDDEATNITAAKAWAKWEYVSDVFF